MAKPYKQAVLICALLSILAIGGAIFGLIFRKPLVIIISLLPTVGYEVYRTEGRSTRWASSLMLLVLLSEIAFIYLGIDFNLVSYLGISEKEVAGFRVPLGDIKVVAPALITVLAIILFVRTYGIYTKWLALVIFGSTFAIVYSLDPVIFKQLLRLGVEEGLEKVD